MGASSWRPRQTASSKKIFFVRLIERSSNPGRFVTRTKVKFHGKTQSLICFLEECNLTSKRAMLFLFGARNCTFLHYALKTSALFSVFTSNC